ncbi:MAG: sulfotransferase [Anaerolineae bacterium]|nr:sulfotransferase [Thermoflexales bacterium]MDW8407497.1 sulfotransferase [Anaerolineae bacterium]
MLITVIGRGHSGTRAISHTLTRSGVYMGAVQNISGDLLPPDDLYEACRIMARHVVYKGDMAWDFSRLHTMPIDPEFIRRVESYLSSVLGNVRFERKGWKLPETTLIYPWIVRLFPDAYYIHWVRDPRDSIIGAHLTDDLAEWGVPYEPTEDVRLRRAISWKYQREIVKATPPPRHTILIRFEDFVLKQEETLAKLKAFLGFDLVKIPVRPGVVGRWKTDAGRHDFEFFAEDIAELGYEPCCACA